MNSRRTQTPDSERQIESEPLPADPAAQRRRAGLEAATREELVSLVERMASSSEEMAARIDYLTDPNAAAKDLQRRIRAIRNGTRFIAYGETRGLAAEIATIAEDIRKDVLPRDPEKAVAFAEKLFCLDQVIFERADDSDGVVGYELREACVLWLDAAAAVRTRSASSRRDWPAFLCELYRSNDYGVREPLLEQAHRLFREEELRALAARFEADARRTIEDHAAGKIERYRVFSSSTAMGLVARALRDPKLYEQSIRVHSPDPNALQANDIAEHYLDCGDGAGALRWLSDSVPENARFERFDLMDRAYALLGDRERQIEIRTKIYRRAPGLHTFRALAEILPTAERDVFRTRACTEAQSNLNVASAAELLFALGEPGLAEQLILDRAGELDGHNYVLLTELAKTAKVHGRRLAAALIWRALLDAILARGYAKAYGHGARYLLGLRDLAASIDDYRGHPSHDSYESALRLGHGRKTSFWARLNPVLNPD